MKFESLGAFEAVDEEAVEFEDSVVSFILIWVILKSSIIESNSDLRSCEAF